MEGKNLVHINGANHLSVNCDCVLHPVEPETGDLIIFASLGLVALDQASCDTVVKIKDSGKKALIGRMDSYYTITPLKAQSNSA